MRWDEITGQERAVRLLRSALEREQVHHAYLLAGPPGAGKERAQNTLLKTLEEPPPATTFLLISAHPDSLLATVRSRCARVQFAPPPGADAPADEEMVQQLEGALSAADEIPALDLAEGRRDDALAVALTFHHWTRDRLVARSG